MENIELGPRRTRAGVVAEHGVSSSTSTSPPPPDEFHATPPLPPVPRSKQAAVLVASFFAIALTVGWNQSFGVFQEYYLSPAQNVLEIRDDKEPPTALLAFVGTLGAGLTWAGSIVVNPVLSRLEHLLYLQEQQQQQQQQQDGQQSLPRRRFLSPQWITFSGVVLMAVGFLLASFATQVWQLLLTQGLLYGLGSSMLYFPLLGPAPEYFSRHRATALGLILSGGGVGSVVMGPSLRALLSALGGRWTLRIAAAVFLLVGCPVAWAVPTSRFPVVVESESDRTMRRRTHVSTALLVTPVFVLSVVAAFCQSAGAQLPLTFLPSYTVALGHSASTGASLLAAANIINAAARVVSGYAGDRLGRLNVLTVSLAGATAAIAALWGLSVSSSSASSSSSSSSSPSPSSAPSYHLWLASIILYSVTTGGYYALFPATIADVFGIRSYAAVNGFIYFIRGCGVMVGSPVGGALISKSGGSSVARSYGSVVAFDSALLVGSAVCILGVRWADAVRRGWAWRA